MVVGAAAPLTYRDVLRIDVIRRVWYAEIISVLGDFIALVAVLAAVAFTFDGTARQVVAVQVAFMLPTVLVGPIAGVFVDRWPLKPTLIASDFARAGLALLLLLSSSVWHLCAVVAALSGVSAFFNPAQQSTIRSHVPPEG